MKIRAAINSRQLALGAIMLAVFWVVLPVRHSAAAPDTQKGSISVTPAIVNLTLPPGQQEAKSTITLTNNYDKQIRLTAEWQAIDEATGRLIPSGPLNPNLAKSLSISETDILIAPKSSKQVTVVVNNSSDLAPGGHYATLVFTQVSSGNEKLGLQSALSVTVFTVKRDGARASIELSNVTARHTLFSFPTEATVSVINTGNVHVVPRAAITIERKGNVLAKAVVNETSAPLLPGKQSTFRVRFTNLGRIYWPARLQMRVVYRIDQSADVTERVSSFWYVPIYWPVLLLTVIVGAFFLVRKGRKVIHDRIKKNQHRHNPKPAPITRHKPVSSQINISAVGISPSHAVPVSKPKARPEPASESQKITVRVGESQKHQKD